MVSAANSAANSAAATVSLTPRTFADLLALYNSSPAWQPPIAAENATPAEVSATIDRCTEQEIMRALQADVLGMDESGRVKVYSEFHRRTTFLVDPAKLKYENLLAAFGAPVKAVVSRTNDDDVPGRYPIRDVREALSLLGGYQMLGDESELGLGCWPIVEEEGAAEPDAIILVNARDGASFNGAFVKITHPRHKNRLLNFEHGAANWYDFDRLSGLLIEAQNKEFRSKVADDLINLFNKWRWKGKEDRLVATGLVLATWVQAAWAWRPRIDVLGESGTGKSMLCEALSGIFRDLVISTADTSFAGLAQEMQRHMAAVIVDEMDAKDKESKIRQRQIIKGLRSASRGTVRIRGTGGQKATKFTLRHLAWVAGISLNYDDQADRNRAVILHLDKPTKELSGKLVLPSADYLHDLGQRSLATALWCIGKARPLAMRLKDVAVPGADQRQAESYAVPAAMIATLCGFNETEAAQQLSAMLNEAKEDQPIEADQVTLVKEMLGASVLVKQTRMTVGQAIEHVCKMSTDYVDWLHALEGSGVRVDNFSNGAEKCIIFRYQAIKAKLLHHSRWAEESIEQYLERVEGSRRVRKTVGGVQGRCMAFPLDAFRAEFMGEAAEF